MIHNQILQGDVIERLKELPDECVQTIVTSPPYWGLRNYDVKGQIGLEPTPDEYVDKVVEVFRGVRRVLRPDGTLWLNLGDSYYNGDKGGYERSTTGKQATNKGTVKGLTVNRLTQDGLKPKDMIGIPWMVAFALRSDGWYLRSDIIWAKPNPMPESVTDRPTKAHEYLFLLSKSQHYYYDAEAIKEQGAYDPGGVGFGHGTDAERRGRSRVRYSFARKVNESPVPGMHPQHRVGRENIAYCDTRNKRTVWTIATHPFLEAHFATFPPALVEPCILAGSSHMSCSACGAPWKRVVRRRSSEGTGMRYQETDTVGWMPTCSCPGNDGSGCCIVLDPFLGSGTTAMVATQNERDYIGIELNPAYVRMAQKRLQGVVYQQRLFV